MYLVERTDEFDRWLRKLKDRKAKARILVRIQRIQENGNFGDCKSIGDGLTELRIYYAKGYRVYLKQRDGKWVLLIAGGDKSTQSKDILKARSIWKKYKLEGH